MENQQNENLESRTFTVYPSLWKEFGKVCDSQGYDRSKLIRNWIKEWLEDKTKING